jgi:hypothetical protein
MGSQLRCVRHVSAAQYYECSLYKDWRAVGGRLCIMHLRACADATRSFKPLLKLLKEEVRSLQTLTTDLHEFIRNTGDSAATEPQTVERRALDQLAAFLAGGDLRLEFQSNPLD